jgi:hypothetical protein
MKRQTTDKETDKMVYELYELTEEEIKIVDGELKYQPTINTTLKDGQ